MGESPSGGSPFSSLSNNTPPFPSMDRALMASDKTVAIVVLSAAAAAGILALIARGQRQQADNAAAASAAAGEQGAGFYAPEGAYYFGQPGDSYGSPGGGSYFIDPATGDVYTTDGTDGDLSAYSYTRPGGREIDPYADYYGPTTTTTTPTTTTTGGTDADATGGGDGFLDGARDQFTPYNLGATAAFVGLSTLATAALARRATRSPRTADDMSSGRDPRRGFTADEPGRVKVDSTRAPPDADVQRSRRFDIDAPGPYKTGSFDVADARTGFKAPPAAPDVDAPTVRGGATKAAGALGVLELVAGGGRFARSLREGEGVGVALARGWSPVSPEQAHEINQATQGAYFGAGLDRTARYAAAGVGNLVGGTVRDLIDPVGAVSGTARDLGELLPEGYRPVEVSPERARADAERLTSRSTMTPSSGPRPGEMNVQVVSAFPAPSQAAAVKARAKASEPMGPQKPPAYASAAQRAILRGDGAPAAQPAPDSSPAPAQPAPAPRAPPEPLSGLEARERRIERAQGGF